MLSNLKDNTREEFRVHLVDLVSMGRLSSELLPVVAEAIVTLSVRASYNEFRNKMYQDLANPDYLKSFQYSFIHFSIMAGNKFFSQEANTLIKSVLGNTSSNLSLSLEIIGHIGAREPFVFWDEKAKGHKNSDQIIKTIVGYTKFVETDPAKDSLESDLDALEGLSEQDCRDIRRSAIKALTFMSLQSPANFIPFLRLGDHEAKQSLYQGFGELCLLPDIKNHRAELKTLFFWLLEEVESCTADTEDELFNALGKMMSVLSVQDRLQLLDNVKSKNNKKWSKFLLRACQYLFKPNEDISPHKDIISWIIDQASSQEWEVVEYALCAINILNFYKPKSMIQFVSTDKFMSILAKHLEVREDLITVIMLGAIRDQRDDGRPIRKYALNILSNLIARKNFELTPIQCEYFIRPVTALLADEERNRYQALKALAHIIKLPENDILISSNFATIWAGILKAFGEFNNPKIKELAYNEKGTKYKCMGKLVNLVAWADFTEKSVAVAAGLADWDDTLRKIQEDPIWSEFWNREKLAVVVDPTGRDDDPKLGPQPSFYPS